MCRLLAAMAAIPCVVSAASLSLAVAPAVIPSLPSSSAAHLSAFGQLYSAPIERSGRFSFRNISVGSYLVTIHSQPYVWAPLRVDVEGGSSVDDVERVRVFQTLHGIEWDNKGMELVQRPVELQPSGKKNFYTKREGCTSCFYPQLAAS